MSKLQGAAMAAVITAGLLSLAALAAPSGPATPSGTQTAVTKPALLGPAASLSQAVLIGPEDCTGFDPKTVKQYGGMVRAGNVLLLNYGPYANVAKHAAYVIAMSGFDQQCRVGHLPGEMMYWKKAGHVPSGAPLSGEDCVKINPAGVYVYNISGEWVVMSGFLAQLVNAHADRAAADRAVTLIKVYKFTRACFIARPGNVMTYWLTD